MATHSQLPAPLSHDAVVNLTLLCGGYIHLDGEEIVQGSDETLICPSMSWLLTHRATGARIIFDLGLRKDADNYIPPVAERIRTRVTISVKEDVFDSLATANVDPTTDIEAVIFSHLHYDHVGDPVEIFRSADKIYRDTAHDVRVYKGTRELAVYPDPNNVGHLTCAHADKEAAHEHLLRVRKLEQGEEGGRGSPCA
ncbi:hypothetical protein ACJ72_07236 [Emergomyces africanus]|uniref:Uncharacterized protein n=1 Tax=Emergomyces africanus TaxID=1955775 RepID=A0A1B7NP57_9EURO|nr:hypothetical protein ACJ72_07236 [Emergomyces africanus]